MHGRYEADENMLRDISKMTGLEEGLTSQPTQPYEYISVTKVARDLERLNASGSSSSGAIQAVAPPCNELAVAVAESTKIARPKSASLTWP